MWALLFSPDGRYDVLPAALAGRRPGWDVVSVHETRDVAEYFRWDLTHDLECPCRAGLPCADPDEELLPLSWEA